MDLKDSRYSVYTLHRTKYGNVVADFVVTSIDEGDQDQ